MARYEFNIPHIFHKDALPHWKRICVLTPIQIIILTIVSALTTALALGANWDFVPYLVNIDVVIVNQDQDVIGNYIQNNLLTAKPSFKWVVASNNSISNLNDYIGAGYAWYGLLISSNTTKNFTTSLLSVNNTVIPLQLIYDQARTFNGHNAMSGILQQILSGLSTSFSQKFIPTMIPKNTTFDTVNPSVIINPIPVSPVVLNAMPSVGPDFAAGIFITFMVLIAATIEAVSVAVWSPLNEKVHPFQLHICRLITIFIECFFSSLAITLILLAFGPVFHHGFMAAWMWFWLTLYAECLMIGTVGVLLRSATGFFIPIFIILLNVSSQAILPYELSNGFYYIGLIFPPAHAVWGARTVINGGYNRIGINIGVLFAFILVCIVVICIKLEFDVWYIKYSEKRKANKQAVEKPIKNNDTELAENKPS
jgi:hypothetical protein